MIEFQNVTKIYRSGSNVYSALKGISFRINKSELVAIVGASGSGKTTTMNLVGLLDRPTSGQYKLKGTDVSDIGKDQQAILRNQSIGFVFQSFFLLPRLTAIHNVGLPLTYRKIDNAIIKERAMTMLEKVGMEKFAAHKPNELSGGQQQRVAIARALIGNPDLILADEPTGSLDSSTGQDVLRLLKQLNKEEGATIIIITHDLNVATACPHIIQLNDGLIIE